MGEKTQVRLQNDTRYWNFTDLIVNDTYLPFFLTAKTTPFF